MEYLRSIAAAAACTYRSGAASPPYDHLFWLRRMNGGLMGLSTEVKMPGTAMVAFSVAWLELCVCFFHDNFQIFSELAHSKGVYYLLLSQLLRSLSDHLIVFSVPNTQFPARRAYMRRLLSDRDRLSDSECNTNTKYAPLAACCDCRVSRV
jgi:hypothetical protein